MNRRRHCSGSLIEMTARVYSFRFYFHLVTHNLIVFTSSSLQQREETFLKT